MWVPAALAERAWHDRHTDKPWEIDQPPAGSEQRSPPGAPQGGWAAYGPRVLLERKDISKAAIIFFPPESLGSCSLVLSWESGALGSVLLC